MITKWLQRKGFQYPPVTGTAEARVETPPTIKEDFYPRKEDFYPRDEDNHPQAVNSQGREGSNQGREVKMSADTMTDKLTDDLRGKSDVLASKIADLNHKMDAVFADAHATVDAANAHVDKVAAAVARLKEKLPT